MKHILLFCIIFFFPITEIFAQSAGCSGKACEGIVTGLETHQSGDVFVRTDGDESKLTCVPFGSGKDKLKLSFSTNRNPRREEMYSSILAAYMSGKPVYLQTMKQGSCDITVVVLR